MSTSPTSPTAAQFPSAQASNPALLGWMQGTPPPPEKRVAVADMGHFQFPKTRWAFANMRQLLPTTSVWRGAGPASPLPRAERDDIDAVTFTCIGSNTPMTWAQSLQANYTDAICILHRGALVYERYFGVMQPQTLHMAFSVTKSYVGTLAAMLVHEGVLDEHAPVTALIPEMKGTAYADATVRQVMDMRIGVLFSEEYANPNADVWRHARAGGLFPKPAGDTGPNGFYEFLTTLRKDGEHGQGFTYKTVSTDLLGWLICRATGVGLSALLSQRLWQPLGCEEDAAMLVDATGAEFAGGGLNASLRDMARFGEAMRCEGHFNGRQVVPAEVVRALRVDGASADLVAAFKAGGFATLPGGAYRSMWWMTNNAHGAFGARGVYGQAIYIDPKAEMVIARLASHPLAANVNFDPTSLPAYQAVAEQLLR
jgi:CubicO group peptidase (beta-lactamase class C family)